MAKTRPTDHKESSKRAPGNISWRKRRRDNKKFREKKLLNEIAVPREPVPQELVAEKTPKEETATEEIVEQKGRLYTVSIAVPGSIMDNAQSPELRAYLAGQIARAAVIFEVDEIVVFDETAQMTEQQVELFTSSSNYARPPNCNARMVKILQYLECPQYLRKALFPLQEDLQYAVGITGTVASEREFNLASDIMSGDSIKLMSYNAERLLFLKYNLRPIGYDSLRRPLTHNDEDETAIGILNPLDCLHHLRSDDFTVPYREAVVLDKPTRPGKGSFCDAGFKREVQVDKQLKPRVRVTVELNTLDSSKKLKGVIVSPSTPTRKCGYYWGYNVRLARSLNAVFRESRYGDDGYDVIMGTSDKGQSVDEFEMPQFRHALIVFGGVNGIESCIENDESLRSVEKTADLFHFYLNTCPNQGSRTIRTEEAVLITLSSLRPKIRQSSVSS